MQLDNDARHALLPKRNQHASTHDWHGFRRDAAFNGVLLRVTVGDYDKAIADGKRFQKQHGAGPEADEVAFWMGPFGPTLAFRQSANVDALARLVALHYAGRVRIVDGDSQVFPVGRRELKALHIPGHTLGLVAFRLDDRYLFTGDSIFIRSIAPPRRYAAPRRTVAKPVYPGA